jgi:broad specificity phosphatase PhoE
MDVFLLRHGETHFNRERRCQGISDLELTDLGQQQAGEVAEQLRGKTIDAVYSSHLQRATQTARIVSNGHRVPVTIDRDLRELNHGELEGLTFVEIHDRYREFINRWRSEPANLLLPGGERLVDVDERVWRAINRIVANHEEHHTILVVTHNFPILSVLCRISETPLNNYRTFHLDPCGLSHLSYNSTEGWAIAAVNYQSTFG